LSNVAAGNPIERKEVFAGKKKSYWSKGEIWPQAR